MPWAASDSIFSMLNQPNSMLPPPPRLSAHAKETNSHKRTKVRMPLLTALLTMCMLQQSCLFCMCILCLCRKRKRRRRKSTRDIKLHQSQRMRQILHMIPQVSVVLAVLATELACSASSENFPCYFGLFPSVLLPGVAADRDCDESLIFLRHSCPSLCLLPAVTRPLVCSRHGCKRSQDFGWQHTG